MEDYQKWRRREYNNISKPKPEYLIFPNRTPAQTYSLCVLTAFAVMGLSLALLNITEKQVEKRDKKNQIQKKLIKTHVPFENKSIYRRAYYRFGTDAHRASLGLPTQPPSSSMIKDPDIKYPQPKGQLTL